ncbi:diguanylate cyclase (GGDEF domain) [hydrothermal vent metagenome]|uniref:Diguanylate cyclase (GGDEF domain) n=1 Tax=hydrothermal vent metagenome TaxID=652676 RepID=A0A3B0ZE64_9ZZZZ
MVTLNTAQTVDFDNSRQQLNNPALLSKATEIDLGRQDVDKALRITSVLQTTLDIKKIIEIFIFEASRWVPIDGAKFKYEEQQLSFDIGSEYKNSLTYHLTIPKQSLGEITFMRRKRFTAAENKTLEYLLCGLVYPLRNSLAYESALQAALKDPLTGINNRAAMDASLIREVDLARRHETPLSLIALDLDHFKKVNDTLGHDAGDQVLRQVVNTLLDTIRVSDMVFRFGGEEFVVLLTNTNKKGAMQLAQRIRKQVEINAIELDEKKLFITASLGTACLSVNDSEKSLFLKTDKALYKAKAAGRNCVRFSD